MNIRKIKQSQKPSAAPVEKGDSSSDIFLEDQVMSSSDDEVKQEKATNDLAEQKHQNTNNGLEDVEMIDRTQKQKETL